MAENGTETSTFKWDKRREEAALRVAEGKQSVEVIAADMGIGERTLWRWNATPEFKARIDEHRARWRQEIAEQGITSVTNRVAELNNIWQGIRQIIKERGEALDGVTPGGGTGLLVQQTKVIGTGPHAQTVQEYVVDTGTIRELRAVMEQAAKELGQHVERKQHDVRLLDREIERTAEELNIDPLVLRAELRTLTGGDS